jgi:hypothetical protein
MTDAKHFRGLLRLLARSGKLLDASVWVGFCECAF